MNHAPRLPAGTFEQPHVTIQRVGRWTWLVTIRDGMTQYGPNGYGWHVLGRARAERLARRKLARYVRDQARRGETIRIEKES